MKYEHLGKIKGRKMFGLTILGKSLANLQNFQILFYWFFASELS